MYTLYDYETGEHLSEYLDKRTALRRAREYSVNMGVSDIIVVLVPPSVTVARFVYGKRVN